MKRHTFYLLPVAEMWQYVATGFDHSCSCSAWDLLAEDVINAQASTAFAVESADCGWVPLSMEENISVRFLIKLLECED